MVTKQILANAAPEETIAILWPLRGYSLNENPGFFVFGAKIRAGFFALTSKWVKILSDMDFFIPFMHNW